MRGRGVRRSTVRRLAILVAAGLAVAGLTDVATAHLVRYGSTATVTFRATDNAFQGRVSSPNIRCRGGRTVVLFRVLDGPDQKIKSARTDSMGRWRLEHNAQAGRYYATALKKDIGPGTHLHICKADPSPVITVPPRCGNGFVEAGEPCDDGNTVNGDGCNACQLPTCGDGIVDVGAGEACDDGNTTNGDGCNACQLPTCGDGIVDLELGETCDDGNTVDGDGCDSTCQSPSLVGRLVALEPDIRISRCEALRSAPAKPVSRMSQTASRARHI